VKEEEMKKEGNVKEKRKDGGELSTGKSKMYAEGRSNQQKGRLEK
jgi:hypothetical protein